MTEVPTSSEQGPPVQDWHRLPPVAGFVRGVAGAATGLAMAVVIALAVLTPLLRRGGLWVVLVLPVVLLCGAAIGAWVGRARWRRTRWRLDDQGLRVRRGYLWHVEVLVPRSRVQHLDVERGLLERQFNLATLVVHTAGSQTPALRQSGLADADAVALRDALIPEARDGDAL